MNVLIADDEYLVRASLKSMIKELDMGVHIVGEASDGEDLVEKIRYHKPDLVFADIKMPKMNGLDSIKAVKEQSPNTEWIILTGFTVFEYAKEAMDLGVKKYLLKPVSLKDLSDSIRDVLNEKAEQQKKLNYKFTQDAAALINNIVAVSDLQEPNAIFDSRFKGALLLFDSYLNESETVKFQQKFWNAVFGLKEKFVDPAVRIAFITMPDGNFSAIFAWDESDPRGETKADSFFRQLSKAAESFNTESCSETVISCDECEDFGRLKNNLNQMQEFASLRILTPHRESVSLKDLARLNRSLSPQTRKIIESVIDISENYKNGSYSEYVNSIEQMRYYLSSNKLGLDAVRPFYSVLRHCCPQEDLSSVSDMQSLIAVLKKSGNKNLNSGCEPGNMIDQVKLFVDLNYMKDIGIAQIANMLHVTPNYLSSLFHKKTGENFIHYITKVRLLKARELLLSSDNPQVSQIAKQVGYYTVNYFTKLYKEYFGVCPSEDAAKRR